MSEYRRSSRPIPCCEEDIWEDCRRRPDSRPIPCCDEPCHKPRKRPILRPTPCCDQPCCEPCHRPISRPNPCCCDDPCCKSCQCPIPRPNPCCDEPCCEPCHHPISRPNPCCCDDPCCKPCHRPTLRPNPCCECENVYSPCRPTPTFCDCPCNQEQVNLYATCDRRPCERDTSCGCSIAHELRRLVGKKVMIYLERKQGPVCILGVDEHCIKALVIGSGKIIFINIDSIVSFKEIC